VQLAGVERDLEHVIGRRFVPTGTMNATWNLHVWSCRPCNVKKSALEDDVSAITQLGRFWGADEPEDEELRQEAARKARGSTSRRTGKPVADSQETVTLRGKLGPAQISVTMRAPPQLDTGRVHELALMQLRAFFYWCSYDQATGFGGFWAGGMFPVNGTDRRDFGNVLQVAFAERVRAWDVRLVATTAAAHYRVAIRKHPAEAMWSFALEWNRNYRLVGLFGDEAACAAEHNALPRLEPDSVHEDGPNLYLVRKGRPLDAGDDVLFAISDQTQP
jgi:hypothetical protein